MKIHRLNESRVQHVRFQAISTKSSTVADAAGATYDGDAVLRRIALLSAVAVASACDSSYHEPPRGPSVEPKKIELVRTKPEGAWHTTVSLVAYGGTKERAREKLKRDAERQGCDALLVTGEDEDSFEDPKEGTVKRKIIRADCLVRGEAPPVSEGRPAR